MGKEAVPSTGARIARLTLGGIATNVATQVLAFGTGVLVTRSLGPDARGVFYLVLTSSGILASLGALGIPNAHTVFTAQRRYPAGVLHANTIAVAAGLWAAALAAYSLFHAWVHTTILVGVPPAYLLWGLCQVPLLFYESALAGAAVGAGEVAAYNGMELAKALFAATAAVGLYALGRLDLGGLMLIWTATNVLAAAWMGRLIGRIGEGPPLRLSWSALRATLQFGLRVHLGGVATTLWRRFDTFLLNATYGTGAVGQYSLAVTLTEALWRVVGPVVNAIQQPVVAAGGAEAITTTQRVLRHVLFLLLLLGGGLALAAPWMVPTLYGRAFLPAVSAIHYLLPGTVAVGLAMVISVYFVGVLDRGGTLSLLAWANAGVNVGLCLVLVPRYGILGAAGASAVSYVLGMIAVLAMFRRATAGRWRELMLLTPRDLADYGLFLRTLWQELRG